MVHFSSSLCKSIASTTPNPAKGRGLDNPSGSPAENPALGQENPQHWRTNLAEGPVDISSLSVDDGEFEVLAAADAHLGGGDFDKKIVGHFVTQYQKKT
jgi:hypothetical protein